MYQFNMFDPNTYKSLYTPDFFIDTLQKTKSVMTDKVITDPVLNKAAHNFMDAQTAFAKAMSNNATTIAKHSVDSLCKYWFPTHKTKGE